MGLTPVFGVKRKCTVFRCDDVDDVIDAVLEFTKKKNDADLIDEDDDDEASLLLD